MAGASCATLAPVPMTVNVATGEQLEKFKIFDVKDVQQLAPGLELTNVSGRNNTTTLRGISFDPDQGTSPAVQVYLNEIPTDAQTVYTAIYDVQQIEVLRGPQGLLRGLSAPAGAITIATRRPDFDKPEGYAQISGTTRAGYNAQMGVSLPFSDKFAIRVAALVDGNRLNNVYNVTRGERSKSTTESARITLGWKPTDNFTSYLTYQYLEADNRQFQQVFGTGSNPYSQYFTIPVTGGVNISYEVTPDLNVFAAYGHSFRAGSTGVAVPAGISNDLIRTNPEKSDSFEAGFKGTLFDRRVNYSVSGYYQKIDNFLSRFTDIYYNAPAAQPTTGFFDFNYNTDATIKGVEASFDGRVSDNWDLGVSAAYTKARFDKARVPCTDFAGTGVPNRNGAPKVTGTGNVSYCIANGRLAEVPDFSLTANTELRVPMGDFTPFVRALFTYRPGFDSERAQYTYQSRELLNMFLGVRTNDGKWEFDVFARNLLDQRRITQRGLGSGTVNTLIAGVFDSGLRQVSMTNTREFGATLKFNW